MRDDLPQDPHKYYEDMMAMVLGTLFVALGVAFLYPFSIDHWQHRWTGITAELRDWVGIWFLVFCHQCTLLLFGD